ncbi:bacteriophage N4 adsorption protein B [compost metagenome]
MLDLFDLDPKDRLISQLMLSQGILSAAKLQDALRRSKDSVFFSLAEVVIGQGLITLETLEELLVDYCKKLRLGELALAKGLITEEQLQIALAMQEASGSNRIGEVFIELHFATPTQIEMLLGIQQHCRETAAIA